MKTIKYFSRAAMIDSVCTWLTASNANDLPMIRQAVNDTADMMRKDGYRVRDFAQDRIVRDIQKELRSV